MNCIDPVRDRLVEVTDQTVVTLNQATVATSLSRDGTALHVSALKLRTSECTKASNIPEKPSSRRATRPGLWLAPDSQPSQCSQARVSRVSAANPQARSRVSLTPSSEATVTLSGAEVPDHGRKRKTIMTEVSSTPVRVARRAGGDGVVEREAHADLRADSEPAALPQLGLCLPRAGETPKSAADVAGSPELYSAGLSTNQAQGQLAGRQTEPPQEGR